jgi:hypothetical protein
MVLHELEGGDGPAELDPLLGIFERQLVGRHHAPH